MDAAAVLIFTWMRTLTLLPWCQVQTTSAPGTDLGIYDLRLEQSSTSVMVLLQGWMLSQLEVAVDVAGISMLMEIFL